MGVIGCGQIDLRDVPENEKIVIGGVAWVAADVSEKIYFYNNRPYCVMSISQAAYATICNNSTGIPAAISMAAAGSNIFGTSSGGTGGSGQTPENSTDRVSDTTQPGLDESKMSKMAASVDYSSMNKYGFMPAALLPSYGAIPMKSNIRTYGPYASSNFGSAGGTNVEKNTDLAPWVFGSAAGMHGAGTSMANVGVAGLTGTETGSLTIPGFPIPSISNLGDALSSAGASLTDLNFSYGSTGVTTTYNFKTYTPKFGTLSRHTIDRIKEAAKYRTEQLRFLRSQQIDINKVGRKLVRYSRAASRGISGRTSSDRGSRSQASLQRLLIGAGYPWENLGSGGNIPRFVVGASELGKASAEMTTEYATKAYMSLDAFFLPVSKAGSGGYSKFAINKRRTGANKAHPLPAQPAVGRSKQYASSMDEYNLDINIGYLDPLTNPGDDAHHAGDKTDTGHTIDIIGKGITVDNDSVLGSTKSVTDEDRYASDYRFFAMRGPLMLQSWGYDTDGKPIPNAQDTDAGAFGGNFVDTNLKDEFLRNWISKPQTWPVAPIDLRFDRRRGVWTTAPQYNILTAKLTEKLEPNRCAEAIVVQDNIPTMYDKFGGVIQDAYINVCDRIGQSIEPETEAYVYYDALNNEYIVLNYKQKSSDSMVRFRLVCPSRTAGVVYGDNWTKQTAYGDKALDRHHLGIRIDCDGNPVDSAGTPLNHAYMSAAFNDSSLASGVFITLRDNPGMWGPSFSYWNPSDARSYGKWRSEAATGFASLIESSGILSTNCSMGIGDECTVSDLPFYDIVFLESYSRFIECELTQDLYWDKNSNPGLYTTDEWKQANPNGNAAVTLHNDHYWGNPGNGKRPMFHDIDLKELPIRVFDPYADLPANKNKNRDLVEGDRVLAVFDETKKKYFIYDHPKPNKKIITFGLAQRWKNTRDTIFVGLRLDCGGYPTTADGKRRLNTNDVLTEHHIYINDPTAVNDQGFGPAAGGQQLIEFIEGITNADGNKQYYPFRGYAVEQSGCFECIYLQHFANNVRGTVTSPYPNAGVDGVSYPGTLDGWTDGVYPVGYELNGGTPISAINYKYITAGGDYIGGSFDNQGNAKGCSFVALLDRERSVNGALQYTMQNAQHFAKRLYLSIKQPRDILALNSNGFLKINNNQSRFWIYPEEGFLWDPDTQPNFFNNISIYNKNWWTGSALVLPFNLDTVAIICDLTGYSADVNGVLEYVVNDAATIAQAGNGSLGVGSVFSGGIPNPIRALVNGLNVGGADYKINQNNWQTRFYHGISPLSPNVNLGSQIPYFNTQRVWLTHSGSNYVCLWDERGIPTPNPEIGDGPHYELIYADEAPVIITARAITTFYPQTEVASLALMDVKLKDESVGVQGYSSHPYPFHEPIPWLLTTAFNPQRHGAKAGDLVTVQRVSMDDKRPSVIGSNKHYAYIVIGTGENPEANPSSS